MKVGNKMDRRKRYFLILDVETANSLDDPMVYDIGFIVGDKQGNVYERYSFATSEVFDYYGSLLKTAYYKEKIPQYYVEIANRERIKLDFYSIRKTILSVMSRYNITAVYAYNCHFDRKALNFTQRYFTKSKYRYFFPYGTEFYCIWNMACTTILQQKTFKRKAQENNWYGANGKNITTNAETVYKYITGEDSFQEEHKGIDDVLIEYQILLKCIRQHKKMDKTINRQCWRKVK